MQCLILILSFPAEKWAYFSSVMCIYFSCMLTKPLRQQRIMMLNKTYKYL